MSAINAGSGVEPSSKSIVSLDALIPANRINTATSKPAQPSISTFQILATSTEMNTSVVAIQSVKLSSAEPFNALELIFLPIFDENGKTDNN